MGGYNTIGRCIGYATIAYLCSSCMPHDAGRYTNRAINYETIDYNTIPTDRLVAICDSLQVELRASEFLWFEAKKAACAGDMAKDLLKKEKEAFNLNKRIEDEYQRALKVFKSRDAGKGGTTNH